MTIEITYSYGEEEHFRDEHSIEQAFWRMESIVSAGGVILNIIVYHD